MSSRHEERSPLVEYYSGFPSASTPSVKDAPTVLLFGWFGCRDRYLAKYSALYEQRGYADRSHGDSLLVPRLHYKCVQMPNGAFYGYF